MRDVLGIDTSNYTTSAALYCAQTGEIRHKKKLLPVKQGQMGLRQSDAVFHHTQQLPELLEQLLTKLDVPPAAVGASLRPRDVEGSYMPCFTVGSGTARSMAAALSVPCYGFSHQAGHIAAALYSAGRLDLLQRPFLAFHVSGGTTEAVLVRPDSEQVICCELLAHTLDLNAGQAVDRVGGMLHLPFPAGPSLEQLAQSYPEEVKARPVVKGMDCCLSGVENLCRNQLERGDAPERIALFCITYIAETLSEMCRRLLDRHGNLPVLFAGGVMSNTIIRKRFQKEFDGLFAQPELSADNAAGVSVLTAVKAGLR